MYKSKIYFTDFCFHIKTNHKDIEEIIKGKYPEAPSINKRRCTFHLEAKYDSIDCTEFRKLKENRATIKGSGNNYKINSNFFETNIYWKKGRAILRILPDHTAPLSIENFFRIFYALSLLENDGFLLHTAASIYAGKALLFCGQSGAGKSTLANLLKKEMEILTDDIIAIKQINKKWFVQAVSFRLWNKKLRDKLYPIGAIFKIKKTKIFRIEPLPSAHRLNLLMSTTPFLPDSKRTCSKLLDKAELVAEEVPFYNLGFSKKNIPFKQLVSVIK